jgi:hypothetical protein
VGIISSGPKTTSDSILESLVITFSVVVIESSHEQINPQFFNIFYLTINKMPIICSSCGCLAATNHWHRQENLDQQKTVPINEQIRHHDQHPSIFTHAMLLVVWYHLDPSEDNHVRRRASCRCLLLQNSDLTSPVHKAP